ncbi:DUF1176 domain-containing protein [Nitratireductor sp. StC3]|uniref:DUF1176 domain-containing protein n=1 Tax=Nitratireductor sp. StC3 TaxID=2126741 RepID=UPI000D0DCB5F|nr:DUF1176 domain-containing protein [Nitratireductor sp. StC3]PSM19814.1 DUF1176 domain-containing protein [Nitratireductor sp. StC3]
MRTGLSCLVAAMAAAAPAAAQDRPYLDDRSDAAALIASYYNAVNRKEYARAWSYFGDDKPAATLDDFAAGYAATESVALVVGAAAAEGAAGSVFYRVPVAIRATEDGGTPKLFAGCYTARLIDPQIQDEPFRPLFIVAASLEPASEPLEDALPAQCGDAPAGPAGDAGLERAKALFQASYAQSCGGAPPGSDGPRAPDVHTIGFRYSTDDADAPERQMRLFRFYCRAGAYNEMHVYYREDEIDGVRELHFAMPELDIRYRDDDSEGPVDSMRIVGFTAENQLVNSDYDPENFVVTAYAKWRGLGDAAASGTWLFRQGQFSLVKYEVDATYDGAVNPELLLDYYSAP